MSSVAPAPVKSQPIFVRVITHNLMEPDADPLEMTIDYTQPERRKWLASHFFWAINNSRSVEILNVKDDTLERR